MKLGSVLTGLANTIPISAIINFAQAVKAFTLNSFAAPDGPVAMNGQKLTGLGTPTTATDAATKGYADTQDAATQTAAVAAAKTYTDSSTSAAQGAAVASAKAYTDTQDAATLAAAKTYTDGKAAPANVAKVKRGSFTGDGASSTFNIKHDLNNYTFVLSVIDAATNQLYLVDYPVIDLNNASVLFGSPPANGEVFFWTAIG